MAYRPPYSTVARILALIFSMIIYMVTAASAYCNLIDPREMPLAAIVFMGFPIMLCLTVIATLINLLWNKRLAIAGAICIAICAPSALSFFPLHFGRDTVDESVSTDTFSVMTYNTFYFNSYISPELDSMAAEQTVTAILDADPDIVVMQESMPIDPFLPGRTKVSAPLSAMVRALYPYRHFSPRAMGVMSKYPFDVIPVNYTDGGEQSFILERYDVAVGDSTVRIFNVHLQSLMLSAAELFTISRGGSGYSAGRLFGFMRNGVYPKLASAFRKRAEQGAVVHKIIENAGPGATVICGDFNDVPGCYAMREIAGDNLRDAYATAGLWPAISYRKHRLYFRIDQMLYSQPLKALGSKVITRGGSDHFPLFTLFRFNGKK